MKLALEKVDQLIEALDRKIELSMEMIETTRELRRIMLLAKLEPRVAEGKASTSVRCIGRASMFPKPADYIFTVRFHIGEPTEDRREIPMADVPREFWPDELREAVERQERRRAKARDTMSRKGGNHEAR